MIGKLSKPVTLSSGNTIMLELSMDFWYGIFRQHNDNRA
jgi:hypothetical protein